MPIEIVRDVESRCKAGSLKPWESAFRKKNNLGCHGLGEAIASIVEAKRKKESSLSLEEFYQSLSHVDIDEANGIYEKYKKDKKKKTFEILGKEIFAVGEWNGDKYSEKDLDQMVDAFQKLDFKPFLKINHDKNKENDKTCDLRPALGFVSNLYRKGKKLIADFSCVPKKLFDAIENGAYNRVSAEIFWNLKRLGKAWPRALKAVSILGTDLPAVESLEGLNDLYEIEGNAISCYEGEDEAKIYELEVEKGKLKEFFMSPLAWEELADSYVYPVRFKSSFMEIKEEKIDEGITRFFGDLISGVDDNATAGYKFDKSNFTLNKAKRWIEERRFSTVATNTEIIEYQGNQPTKEEIIDDLNALLKLVENGVIKFESEEDTKQYQSNIQAIVGGFGKWAGGSFGGCVRQLKGKAGIKSPDALCAWMHKKATGKWPTQKSSSLGDDPKECIEELFFTEEGGVQMDDEKKLQELTEELEAKEKELTAKIEEVEKLKTETEKTEEASKEFSDKVTELTSEKEKLETQLEEQKKEVKKFEEEKKEAEEKARIVDIKSFIDKQKQEGRVLPRFEPVLLELLKASPSEEKVIEYSLGDKKEKASIGEAVRKLISSLPKIVNFAELSAGGEVENVSDSAEDQLDAAAKKLASEKKISYSEAFKTVGAEHPELVEAWFDKEDKEDD